MIQAYSFKPYDDDSIVEYLQNYVKKNPCCFQYPNCTHPPHQSDPNVFKIDNPTIQYIKKHPGHACPVDWKYGDKIIYSHPLKSKLYFKKLYSTYKN